MTALARAKVWCEACHALTLGELAAFAGGREGLSASDLKSIIVDAALTGYCTTRDAEDLISFYGLRHV